MWAIPFLAVIFVLDPWHTIANYPSLWTLRTSVVLDKFWPTFVPFTAGFAAWAGSQEGRRNVADLLGTTARPAWTRQLCALGATTAWTLTAFLAGVILLYVRAAQGVTWGGPPLLPAAVGLVALGALCAFTFMLGALFPGRFTAPIVAVGITVFSLAVFHRGVSQGGTSLFALSPNGIVPGNDAGVFFPVAPDVALVQIMFYGGVILASIGLLGLSPRAGGTGWRGALDVASGGGARLRAIATTIAAVGIALAATGGGLAATARVSATGGIEVPALHDAASDRPIPYTPVCAKVSGTFRVCVHPAYRNYLGRTVSSLRPVLAELAGIPGVPVRAVEVPGQSLPSAVMEDDGNGVVAGNPPVYRFSMNNAITQVPDADQFRDGFEQDIVHAVILGQADGNLGAGGFQPDEGTPAQQAVVYGLLSAIGSSAYGSCWGCRETPSVLRAGVKFAALPAAARHAWLVSNFAALEAGRTRLAEVP